MNRYSLFRSEEGEEEDNFSPYSTRDLIKEYKTQKTKIANIIRLSEMNAMTAEEYAKERIEQTLEKNLAFMDSFDEEIAKVEKKLERFRCIPNFESTYSDGAADIEDEIELEMDPVTKAKMDAVFATFSDLELFILMKEFGFFGKEIGSMTAREMSYQDYFVDMARKEKLGAKNIEFGTVKVTRPGRNSGAEEVLLVENVFYVKERYYNNKVAKIRKKLASLATTVEKDDLLGFLDGYCWKLWKERGFMN